MRPHLSKRLGKSGEHLSRHYIARARECDEFGSLREILGCVLCIIRDSPGNVIDPKFNISDDEKELDEYFRRQYGYVPANTFNSDLITAVVEVKLICCRIATVCMELLHSKTATELHGVFSPIFESFKISKLSEEDSSKKSSRPLGLLRKKNKWSALQTAVVKNKMSLTSSEAARLRDRTLTALEGAVSRNPEMIWTVRELFHEETFKILLHQVYFNSPELRAEALNLIFRVHSFRAELAQYLLKELQESRVEDCKTIAYVTRQRSALQQVLARFHFVSKPSSASEDDEEPDEIDLMFRLDVFKLRKVLLNLDRKHGSLGIVHYCFDEEQTEQVSASESNSRDTSYWNLDRVDSSMTDMPEPASAPPLRGLNRFQTARTMLTQGVLSKIKANNLKVGPAGLTMNSPSEAVLESRENEALNQKMLVDLDLHRIVLEFLTKNVDSFIFSIKNRHRGAKELRSKTTVSSVIGAFSGQGLFGSMPTATDQKSGDEGGDMDPIAAARATALKFGFDADPAVEQPEHHPAGGSFSSDGESDISSADQPDSDDDLDADDYGRFNPHHHHHRHHHQTKSKREGKAAGVGGRGGGEGEGEKKPHKHGHVVTDKRRKLGTSRRILDYVQVFELCFLFLRALIRNNPQVAAVLSTRQVIGLALELRQYCPEAVRYFIDLVHESNSVVGMMEDADFNRLLKDVRDTLLKDTPAMPLPISQYGMTIKNTSTAMDIIHAIALCGHDLSESRVRQFRDVLEQDCVPFGAVARTKGEIRGSRAAAGAGHGGAVGKASTSKVPDTSIAARLMQLGTGQSILSDQVYSVNFITPDARYMCLLYYAETGRTTFSRLPQHVLADEPLGRRVF